MDRKFYIGLAENGLRMPIGADLLLKEKNDHDRRLYDGVGLGEVIVETAHRFNTPLAFPLMDLTVEKEWLLALLEIADEYSQDWHLNKKFSRDEQSKIEKGLLEKKLITKRIQASCDALKYVSQNSALVPIGMSIGPFSMMTTLLADPITAVFMAGTGALADDDEEVATMESALEVASMVILKSIKLQLESGAKAICVCEPAANKVYISPKQIESGSDIFDRYVLGYNQRICKLLTEYDADLIFHNCGELTDKMVLKYNELNPAILSLGSSRKLWEDARLVSKSTVLFGNIPSKKFYSNNEITQAQVRKISRELLGNMKKVCHPFILGTECDVLSVNNATVTIMENIDAMLTA